MDVAGFIPKRKVDGSARDVTALDRGPCICDRAELTVDRFWLTALALDLSL